MADQQQLTIIHSDRYGELRVSPDQLYAFERGIIGFPEYRSYGLVPIEETPFHILHAREGQTSFILLPAHLAAKDYDFEIDNETASLLKAEAPEEVAVFVIVNMTDDAMFVNLKAPILLVPSRQTGCQFIINNRDYPIRALLGSKEQPSC